MIEPDRRTLHGCFSRDFPPVLTIDSGQTVHFRFLDAGWSVEQASAPGAPGRHFEDYIPERRSDGHALCGPIAIRGATRGMTLEVQVGAIVPADYGFTMAGGCDWSLYKHFGVDEPPEHALLWRIDAALGTATSQTGHRVRIAPFLGVMGMPPDEPGIHSTSPPRYCGGNIDCKELVSGSSLFLPISVEGALFSAGDGHAAQGDGELSGTAIECPIQRAELTFVLHPNLHLSLPRARTPAGWITFGFHSDLYQATIQAGNSMLDLMIEQLGVSRKEAIALASVAVNFHLTQVVNQGIYGMHAILPDGAIERTSDISA